MRLYREPRKRVPLFVRKLFIRQRIARARSRQDGGRKASGSKPNDRVASPIPFRLDLEGRDAVSTDCIIERATEYIARESYVSRNISKKKNIYFL